MQTQHMLRQWNGKTIRQRADGWFSLTDMAAAGDKKFSNWYRLEATQAYIAYVEGVAQIAVTEIKQGGFDQGTWGHEDVAIELAMWVSIPFKYQVIQWAKEVITEKTEAAATVKTQTPMLDPNAAIMMEMMREMLATVNRSNDRPLQGRTLDEEETRLRSVRKEYKDSIDSVRMAGEHVIGTERSLHLYYQAKLKQLGKGDILTLPEDVWVDTVIKGVGKTSVNLTRFERQLADYRYIASREAAAIFDQKNLWSPMPFTTTSARNMLTKAGWVQVAKTYNKVAGRRKQSSCHDSYWMRQCDTHLLRDGELEPHDLDILDFAYKNMVEEAEVCSVSTQAIQMAWNTSHLGKQIYVTGNNVGRALRRLGFTPHRRDVGTEKDSFWDFPADE